MRAIGGSTPIRIAWPQIAAFSVGRILALLAALCLVSPAWALSPAVELLLFGGVAPTWQWSPLATNALPSDGSVTDASPSLGGLVLDATTNCSGGPCLTFAGNNALLYPSGTTLATQTTAAALSSGGNYLLCLYGTGSVTLSGAYSGSLSGTGANNQVNKKFVATSSAALTATVSGSVTSASLSAVTYETSCRAQDQVYQSTAYYGPKFDYGAGLRVWEQRRNDFLNSATGATQDVTVTATPYALSCFGSGTITLTGTSTAGPLTCAGAITGPIPSTSLLFTPTAGTLHLVVSGSATYVNLEQGAYPSPRILTYGSAVTASADVVQYAGPLLALMRGTRASLIVETNKALGTYTFQVGNASYALLQSYGSNALRTYFNCVFNSPAFNGTFAGGIVRSGVSYDGTTRTIVGNGGTPASGSCATSLGATQYLGYGLGSYYMNGYVTNVSAYNTALSPAKLQAKTVPGAQW